MQSSRFIQLATIEAMGRRYRVGVIPDGVSGPDDADIGSIWRSIRRASRRLDPRVVAKAVVRYAYDAGVRRPLDLTVRAARIAQLAASGDKRALSLAVQTARDAARGVPGAVVAYKAVRAFDHVYRSRPVQTAITLADHVPAASVVTAPARALGAGAGIASSMVRAIY